MAETDDEAPFAPDLTRQQEVQSHRVESTPLTVIHEVIRRHGEEELARSIPALAWSGLAAGLSMGLSLITEGLLKEHLPAAPWAILISKWGYTVGFVVVILGRQQLFTENTLTPVIPVLAKRDLGTILKMLRLWAVVLVSNLIGALCVAWVLGRTNAFEPAARQAFAEIGRHALGNSFGTTFLRGIFAGWIIALVVWLMPAVPNNRLWVIMLLTWLVGIADLSHVIAGSIETMYLVVNGSATWGEYSLHFMIPALLGNTIGGISLVALINHAQLVAGHPELEGAGDGPGEKVNHANHGGQSAGRATSRTGTRAK